MVEAMATQTSPHSAASDWRRVWVTEERLYKLAPLKQMVLAARLTRKKVTPN
jgi:hypothetical protein